MKNVIFILDHCIMRKVAVFNIKKYHHSMSIYIYIYISGTLHIKSTSYRAFLEVQNIGICISKVLGVTESSGVKPRKCMLRSACWLWWNMYVFTGNGALDIVIGLCNKSSNDVTCKLYEDSSVHCIDVVFDVRVRASTQMVLPLRQNKFEERRNDFCMFLLLIKRLT